MQRKRPNRTIVLAAATAASLAFGGQVSAQVIKITNANNHPIPLKSGSSVQIDGEGNLLAECALTDNVCTQLSTGGSGGNPNAPTAALSRADSDTDVKTNESISLSWSSTGAEACKATSSPANSSFNGVVATSGSVTLVPGSAATHNYSIVCYNAAGGSVASAQAVVVTQATTQEPPPANTGCTLAAGTQGHAPTGWASTMTTWSGLYTPRNGSPIPVYPQSNGFPVPIGASRGAYTAASFTAQQGQTVNMYWENAQANQFQGYSTARPAMGMFISISPCPGDVRASDNGVGGFLASGCRKFAHTGTIVYTTSPAVSASTSSVCKLEIGKQYYINVMPANPDDGLTAGEHSCSETPSSSQGCDVQSISTVNTF